MYFGHIPLLKYAEEEKAFEYYWDNVRNYMLQCCHKEQCRNVYYSSQSLNI